MSALTLRHRSTEPPLWVGNCHRRVAQASPLPHVLAQKRTGRFREEFRTPLGVRKSPKNEPAVSSRVFMGISDIASALVGVRDDLSALPGRQLRHFGR
jgi:hypothetical protein